MMGTLEKWAERIYNETDFGRSVATFVSGVVGLVVYLLGSDAVIATFCFVIVFPVVRLISASLHEWFMRNRKRRMERLEAENTYSSLSEEEREVVQAFVQLAGVC